MKLENEKMERISVTLPTDLISRLDNFIQKTGYPSRSKLVQDAVREFLVKHEVAVSKEKKAIGALLVIFKHHPHNVETKLTHIQHHYGDLIRSTLHIHLDEARCFEVISLNGAISEMKDLMTQIQRVKGVLRVELFIMEEL
ncbi:MAG: nickel-responsive transcriptional regulator NikR [Candidatus Asgardarchaeum sp.]